MAGRALLILNPYAGKKTTRTRLFSQIDALTREGWLVTVYPTQSGGDATRAALEWGGDYDLLVCSGGDGTLCEVVTGLMQGKQRAPEREPPPLGYIPAGTTNDFAASLHLPDQAEPAVETILHGQARRLDVGLFNRDRYFTYTAAFGLMTDVSYSTPQDQKNVWGRMAYFMEGIKRIPEIRSYPIRLEAGSRVLEGDYSFGVVSNATSVAGMIHFDPETVRYDDGYFEVLLIRDPGSPAALARVMLEVMNKVYDEEYVVMFRCAELTVTAAEPLNWCLDGEDGGEHNVVTIRNLKQAYTLLMRDPASTDGKNDGKKRVKAPPPKTLPDAGGDPAKS